MATDNESVDYRLITDRQQQIWATGDFHEIARQVMTVSEALCQAVDPHPGQRVLDVACGSGNAALAVARRYCDVSGIDYVAALVERAKTRANAEGMHIDFRVGDAQALPFADGSFDVVLSVFGVMFAPDQEKAASELLRVCRPGGRIGLCSWMPTDFGGEFFAIHARYVSPLPGVKPPVRWGTDSVLMELFGAGTTSVKSERRTVFQYYRSVDHAIEVFRSYFGPTNRAFQMADAAAQANLNNDLKALFTRYNRATDGTLILEASYLQTIAAVR